MNSLMSYGSDDELDDSSEERPMPMDSHGITGRNYRKPTGAAGVNPQDDTNYDEVQMSLSEDSDAESKSPSKYSRERDDRRNSPKPRESRDSSQRDRREERSDRDRSGWDRNEDRSRRDREDDRTKSRDEKDDRTKSREDDKNKDRHRERDDDKRDRRDDRRPRSRDRERYNNRDDRYKQDRDRRRSRSPRDSRDRDRRRSRSPRRSRSRSRDRPTRGGFQRRFDRGNRMDKNDPRQGNNPADASQSEDGQNKNRFFMPGITGRFRDQIEKRKLLWQKKEPENIKAPAAVPVAAPSAVHNPNAPRATKVWESTTFAQDTDGKVASKFKRLMGIKTPNDDNNSTSEVLKKQDEMFNAMEQQYEVARTTTHTMRGVGLGFSSFNR